MIKLKLLAAFLILAAGITPALAEIQLAIGEPVANSTKSGIGQISGWAVNDVEIVSVEAFIDGTSLGIVPYGGTRQDVSAAFPDIPNSEFSGWSMKWNYSLLSEGDHVVTILVTDIDGEQLSKDVAFKTTAFKSEFISDPERVKTANATISNPEDGRIVITGAEIDGEIVDVELCWDTGSQQFLIDRILREEVVKENQAPTVSAGPRRFVEPGATVVIEASAYDPDGSIVSYSWQQISGMQVELENADQENVSFTAPQGEGSIKLRLTVTDDNGATDRDDVTIEVESSAPENQPPNAYAGSNLTVEAGTAVEITGSASDDDGTIASWYWEQISGPQVSLQDADTSTVRFTAPGNAASIQLSLTVTDDDGATDSDNVTVTVQAPAPPPNQAPSASAGPNLTVDTGETVEITGSASDSDGTIESWNWEQTSGQQVSLQGANTRTVRFTAPGSAGSIQLRLTVSDDDGATDSDSVTVTVEEVGPPPNQSPTANAGPNRSVQQGDSVTLSGGGSDPDGTISDWSWDQVSGTTVSLSNASSQEASFTAPEVAGTLRFRLTVTDDDGASDTDDVTITVEEVPQPSTTTGETLYSWLDAINEARGEARTCGSTSYSAQPPLEWDSSLADIAKQHSMEMAQYGYFAHESLNGSSMGSRVLPYWSGGNTVGENIAASSANRSASYVVSLWLDSAGHCALIMDGGFTHAGIGAGHDTENNYSYHHFWTLDMGG